MLGILRSAVAREHTYSTSAGSGFATFMKLRGRRIIEGCGVRWYSTRAGFYMPIPLQLRLEPEPAELDSMLRRSRALGVRFASVTVPGTPSGLYVCRNKTYDIRSVQHSIRYKVRKGLENCSFAPVETAELISEGIHLNRDTMQRQGRYDPEFGDPEQWARIVRAIGECAQIASVGAYIDGRLAAYAITCREDGWLHILHRMSRLDCLAYYPNHALDFHLTCQIAGDSGLQAVCMGWMPLLPVEGLHMYKQKLGYDVVAQNSAVVMHPLLRQLAGNRFAPAAMRLAMRIRPQNLTLKYASALLSAARASGQAAHGEARLPKSRPTLENSL